MIITITVRNDTHANLAALNRVYKKGEPVWENDNKRMFMGDGVTPFNNLPVVAADITALTELSNAAVDAAAEAAQSAADAAASAGGGTAATTTTVGVTRLSTDAEALAGTDDSIAVTPHALQAALDALTVPTVVPADTTTQGVVELATTTEASTGTDNVRAVTPAGVAAAIAALGVATPDASTTVKGKVELATTAETQTGTDTVRAVTPAGLAATVPVASETAQGKVELATTTEASTGTDTARAVTPAGVLAAINALTVKLAGNQTIAGVKTFASAPVVPDDSFGISAVASLQDELDARPVSAARTYADLFPGARITMLYNGVSGFVDPLTATVATAARPSSRSDIFFDLVGGGESVSDPGWMLLGDLRRIQTNLP